MNAFPLGTRVALKLNITDPISGIALDPTNPAQLNYQAPGQAITRWTYGVTGNIRKISTGVYQADLDCELAGIWNYRFFAAPATTGQFAVEGQFQILPTSLL